MSSDQKKPAKIAILHHTGGGNLGDDAIMDVSSITSVRAGRMLKSRLFP